MYHRLMLVGFDRLMRNKSGMNVLILIVHIVVHLMLRNT